MIHLIDQLIRQNVGCGKERLIRASPQILDLLLTVAVMKGRVRSRSIVVRQVVPGRCC